MKARGSADPKVGKNHDDPDKDSQGQDENQVEERTSPPSLRSRKVRRRW